MPGTRGGQQIYTCMWGPEGPYARHPGVSTNIHIHVGPGGPYAKEPREVNKSTHLCGAWGPVRKGARGVNKHTRLCGARDPKRSTNIRVHVGIGGPYATHLGGRLTNIQIYVGPGSLYARDPGGVIKYKRDVAPRSCTNFLKN
jgi:hypothetical protein